MQKEKIHVLSIRIDRNTQRGIKRMAIKNKRSVNAEIETALIQYILGNHIEIKSSINNSKK